MLRHRGGRGVRSCDAWVVAGGVERQCHQRTGRAPPHPADGRAECVYDRLGDDVPEPGQHVMHDVAGLLTIEESGFGLGRSAQRPGRVRHPGHHRRCHQGQIHDGRHVDELADRYHHPHRPRPGPRGRRPVASPRRPSWRPGGTYSRRHPHTLRVSPGIPSRNRPARRATPRLRQLRGSGRAHFAADRDRIHLVGSSRVNVAACTNSLSGTGVPRPVPSAPRSTPYIAARIRSLTFIDDAEWCRLTGDPTGQCRIDPDEGDASG